MSSFFNKQDERAAYLYLRLSLAVGWVAVKIMILLAPLLRKKKPTKDFLFFSYTHKDNVGTRSRFQEFFPLLDADGYSYDIHYPSTREEYLALYHSGLPSRAKEFRSYSTLFWKRFFWIIKASDYKALFFQRALFPEYYGQRRAILEQLARAYSNNITVDYYDADYVRNEPFYLNIIRYCDKVTVVNQALYDYFSKHHPRVLFNDLSLDGSLYTPKTDFTIHQPVRIFWTGAIHNAKKNLATLMPVLEELNAVNPLKLVMISINTGGHEHSFIEHHTSWDPVAFNNLMRDSDIAVYPAQDDIFTRSKVAYKTMEYAATKVPMVSSPQGLSPHFRDNEDVLVASNPEEWKQRLLQLIEDQSLRQRLAESAYKRFMQYHDVHATYKNFLFFLNA